MPIEMDCPHCGHGLVILDKYIGTYGRCKHCREKVYVHPPDTSTSEPPRSKPPPIPKPTATFEPVPEPPANPQILRGCAYAFLLILLLVVLVVVTVEGDTPTTTYPAVRSPVTPTQRAQPEPQPRGTIFAPAPELCTLEEFNRIRHGMSYDEVVAIIGSPGELSSENYIEGVPGVMDSVLTELYTWDGHGDFGANMLVMFQNDKVIQKSQFGLK